MKKKIIALFSVIFLIVSGYSYYKYLEYNNPNFNTIYAENFQENLFNSNLIGLTEIELKKLLGEPLKKEKTSTFETFLYTDDPKEVDILEWGIGVKFKEDLDSAAVSKIEYRLLFFKDSKECKSEISTLKYQDTFDVCRNKNYNKEKILKLYGEPTKKMVCNCNYKVFVYSKFKGKSTDGTYFINVRLVFLNDENKVVQIFKGVNSDQSYNFGICSFK